MTRDAAKVVALIAAFNEEDVLDHVLADLHGQGVDVYFLDDGSTDRTLAIAEARIGHGVIGIERLKTGTGESKEAAEFRWAEILRRKEALAAEIDADWFIHHDADEFRESPWPDMTLADAIARVDRAGFNAIDFALLDFWPTDETFTPGADVRESIRRFEPGRTWNARQVRCWKKGALPVDLASSGGHDVQFPGRRVYPLRFILRHYPIRSTAHGQRKVFTERIPRFADEERERGWHVQYAQVRTDAPLTRDAPSLQVYDAGSIRAELATTDVERADKAREQLAAECQSLRDAAARALASEQAALAREAEALQREVEARDREGAASGREAAALQRAATARQEAADAFQHGQALTEALDAASRARAECQQQLDAHRTEQRHLLAEIQAIYASLSWRATAPFRAILARLFQK